VSQFYRSASEVEGRRYSSRLKAARAATNTAIGRMAMKRSR
jgi:hypothetical protein